MCHDRPSAASVHFSTEGAAPNRTAPDMPQTVLALFALALATMFSLNQREVTTRAQLSMIRNEVSMVGTGVAAQVFDHIGSFPYDGNGSVIRLTQLTPTGQFGGVASWEEARDIDDFHGQSTVFTIDTEHGSYDIHVRARVRYVENVEGVFQETQSRQWLKQVRLELTGPLGYRVEALTRIFSYYDSDPEA
jgi:hypothetical protein